MKTEGWGLDGGRLFLFLPYGTQVKRDAWRIEYEFAYAGASTEGLAREGEVVPYVPSHVAGERDTAPGAFAQKVGRIFSWQR